MKIEEIFKHANLLNNSGESAAANKSGSQDVETSETKKEKQDTRIELSTASVEVNRIAAMAEKEQPDRIEKVHQLRESLLKGEYEVDSK